MNNTSEKDLQIYSDSITADDGSIIALKGSLSACRLKLKEIYKELEVYARRLRRSDKSEMIRVIVFVCYCILLCTVGLACYYMLSFALYAFFKTSSSQCGNVADLLWYLSLIIGTVFLCTTVPVKSITKRWVSNEDEDTTESPIKTFLKENSDGFNKFMKLVEKKSYTDEDVMFLEQLAIISPHKEDETYVFNFLKYIRLMNANKIMDMQKSDSSQILFHFVNEDGVVEKTIVDVDIKQSISHHTNCAVFDAGTGEWTLYVPYATDKNKKAKK